MLIFIPLCENLKGSILMCFSQAVLFFCQGNWKILIQVSNKLTFFLQLIFLLNNHKTFYRGHVPIKLQIDLKCFDLKTSEQEFMFSIE